MRRFELADLSCLIVVLMWGANMPLVKIALDEFSPMSFNAIRLLLAALLLWILTIFIEGRIELHREDVILILVLGFTGNALYQILFIKGIFLTKAGNVSLLISSGTIFTALWSRFLGQERFSFIVWAGIFLSMGGVTLILVESAEFAFSGGTLLGDLLILGGSLCWSSYTVYSKPLMKRYSPLSLSTLTMSVGALVFLLFSVSEIQVQDWEQVSGKSFMILTYSFTFALVLGYILWLHGVARLGSTRTAIYSNLIPLVGGIGAKLVLGESITPIQIAAGALIATGIYLTHCSRPTSVPSEIRQHQQ